MSVAVSHSDGLTVLTLTSDQSSVFPPLCQLLGALCYSPGCCSKNSRLTPHRVGAQAVLGALWIITGLLHIGLGVLIANGPYMAAYLYFKAYFPMWMGGLFLLFGVTCILSERHPRPIFVLLSGFLNLAGVALSITAIVLYSRGVYSAWWNVGGCGEDRPYYHDYWNTPAPTTESPDDSAILQRCWESKQIQWALTASICAVLITMSVLNLCIALSSTIISLKTMKQKASQSGTKPLLEETKATSKEM